MKAAAAEQQQLEGYLRAARFTVMGVLLLGTVVEGRERRGFVFCGGRGLGSSSGNRLASIRSFLQVGFGVMGS